MGSTPPVKTDPPPQASPPPTPPAATGSPPPPSSPPPNPLSPPPSNPPPQNPSSPPPASPPPPASNPPASPPPPAETNVRNDSPPPPSSTRPSDPSSPPPPHTTKNGPPTPRTPGSPPTPPSPDTPDDSPGPPSSNTSGGLPSPPGTKPRRSSHSPSVSGPASNSSPLTDSDSSPPSDSPPSPGSPPILEQSQSSPTGTQSTPSSLRSTPSHSGSSLVSPEAQNTNKPINAPQNPSSAQASVVLTGGMITMGIVVSFIVLGVLGTIAWYLSERKKIVSGPKASYVMPTSLGSSPQSDAALLKGQVSAANTGSGTSQDAGSSPSEPGGLAHSKSWFTYKELSEVTNGFSDQNLLGEGGFGSVYKGCLADGREVAVKQLKVGSGQGDREFRAEVEIISRIHHRHLVTLVGYCISENRRLLIYDYVPNNTLHFHLHEEGRPVLGWAARVKIAVGAARGIAYLHEDCHPRIIHRDIKSSNILLDQNFEALVSDFGLAKLFQDNSTHVTTRVVGTFGYMAPEYASSGKLTEKSDVFSFGVVLLELITGRKPVDASQPPGEESLVEWARPLLSRALDTEELDSLVDPRLEKCYVDNEMLLMIEAAAACVRHSSANRPRMPQVVRAFDSISAADLSNGMRVGESEMFNSTDKSAEIRFFRRMAFGSQDFTISQDSLNIEER